MSPLLPPGTLFSQHGLDTYLQCPRRFYLKYVERQPWPVPESEEPRRYQEYLERGRVLHQWIARHLVGLDVRPLVVANSDPHLSAWWEAFLTFDLKLLPFDEFVGLFRARNHGCVHSTTLCKLQPLIAL